MAKYNISNNDDVRAMQEILRANGYMDDGNVDGFWRQKTANGIRKMQADLKKRSLYR